MARAGQRGSLSAGGQQESHLAHHHRIGHGIRLTGPWRLC